MIYSFTSFLQLYEKQQKTTNIIIIIYSEFFHDFSRQGHDIFLFSKTPRTAQGPIQLSILWVPWFFPGKKSAGA
jgi:hypothetical protein